MSIYDRRTRTIRLHSSKHQSELDELQQKATLALGAEESGGPRRAGQKSESMEFARQWDALRDLADSEGVEVVVREVSNREWEELAEEHPPRSDEPRDKVATFNLKTFPAALLRKALVTDVEVDALSRAQYMKLEKGCWELHNEAADDLPFGSLVSLLTQQRDSDSQQQPDTE